MSSSSRDLPKEIREKQPREKKSRNKATTREKTSPSHGNTAAPSRPIRHSSDSPKAAPRRPERHGSVEEPYNDDHDPKDPEKPTSSRSTSSRRSARRGSATSVEEPMASPSSSSRRSARRDSTTSVDSDPSVDDHGVPKRRYTSKRRDAVSSPDKKSKSKSKSKRRSSGPSVTSEDESSAYSGSAGASAKSGSGTGTTATTTRLNTHTTHTHTTTTLDHEEEIERIRELRARRLRDEARATGDRPRRAATTAATHTSMEDRREARRTLRDERNNSNASSPSNMERKILEQAGVGSSNREREPRVPRVRRVISGSSEEDGKALQEELSTIEQRAAERQRLREERERQRDRPARSATTHAITPPGPSDVDEILRTHMGRQRRIPPPRAKSADGDLLQMDLGAHSSVMARGDGSKSPVRTRLVRERRNAPPARAKSADEDLLTMDLSHMDSKDSSTTNDPQSKYMADREARRSRRPQSEAAAGSNTSSSSAAVSAIRDRRLAAESQQAASDAAAAAATASTTTVEDPSRRSTNAEDRRAEVKRRLEQRRSGDLEPILAAATRHKQDVMRRLEAKRSMSGNLEGMLAGAARMIDPASPLPRRGNSGPTLGSPTAATSFVARISDPTRSNRPPLRNRSFETDPGAEEEEEMERIPEMEFSSDDESTSNHHRQQWSVRVSVVSAIDLPLNILPNIPLCPVLKFGLVKIPPHTYGTPSEAVLEKLRNRGVESIHTARVRSTSQKILSKRDNGSVDFHQELRWDNVKHPTSAALCIDLCAQAVRTPKNFQESPSASGLVDAFKLAPAPAEARVPSGSGGGNQEQPQRTGSMDELDVFNAANSNGLIALWRKATNRNINELNSANAAAAVARKLVDPGGGANDDGGATSTPTSTPTVVSQSTVAQSDYNVALNPKNRRKQEMTEDMRLGSLVIPLTNLPLDRATNGNEAARIEQWFQLESSEDFLTNAQASSGRRKKPSVLLEISFSSPEILDESEDEMEEEEEKDLGTSASSIHGAAQTASYARRWMHKTQAKEKNPRDEVKVEEPVLQPGVIDFISVVGCTDIGNQKDDDGAKGWVSSTPKFAVLEQFPPNDEFHQKAGRNVALPGMIEWFAFPEGSRLWRGTGPPSHSDLNLKRFSASSPPNVASSIAAFDACLNCTTSFSWFVIASNSDEYGSTLVKTYGACIRFFIPAPTGIDPTQDDFAENLMGQSKPAGASTKRLWVPVAICLSSNLPIVGVMEAMLLRLCEDLVTKVGGHPTEPKLDEIHKSLAKLIVNFQKPIGGAVNCSVPFLAGDRFLLTLPPPTGLPPLPHGHAVVSVCRMLGAEGLNYLLAAILTEQKILIHSNDSADVAMVAEVVTALCYPFTWSLPYIPILPVDMLEFVEAPLSYILGCPSSSLKMIDPHALDDVVVIDLDNGFTSPDYFEARRTGGTKHPTPLPASVATNVSKAVYRLLRAEEEVEEEFGGGNYDTQQSLPRLETESLAEREFRVSIAIQICSLLRGYEECLGPVFNRDKFLKVAPALFEERRDGAGVGSALGSSHRAATSSKILSPRSKRFLSNLVNTQNFFQLLETLEDEGDAAAFFLEIMDSFEENSDSKNGRNPNEMTNLDKTLAKLTKALQQVEDKIPTYRVDKDNGYDSEDDAVLFDEDSDNFDNFNDLVMAPPEDGGIASSFTEYLLKKIPIKSGLEKKDTGDDDGEDKTALSLEYLDELSKNPWKYERLFEIPVDGSGTKEPPFKIKERVKLRDAIGERRYRAWKVAQDHKLGGDEPGMMLTGELNELHATSMDLTSLITSVTDDMTDTSSLSSIVSSLRENNMLSPEQQRVVDAKNRDVIRRCLDRANDKNSRFVKKGPDGMPGNPFLENGRDLIAESEKALKNPAAQRFMLSILGQRSRLEMQRATRTHRRTSETANQASVSRLEPIAFDCLMRLSCAMLDTCMEYKEYEPAYRLLSNTAGFVMLRDDGSDMDEKDEHARHVISMTSRVGLHPIFADIGVWQQVMHLHIQDRRTERSSEKSGQGEASDTEEEEGEVEHEAAVATLYEMLGYGIPGEELSRFATRASEENGWFCDERGKQLLMLARRISVRRETTDAGAAGDAGDIDMIRTGPEDSNARSGRNDEDLAAEEENCSWQEIGWCHPAAPNLRNTMRWEEGNGPAAAEADYMKRTSVTALARFGSSVVVTGGLDGSVFLAHSLSDAMGKKGAAASIRGIHLDWGSASRASASSSSDGEYGVGAVTCLAAAYGSGHYAAVKPSQNGGPISEDELLASMEGSRVVAGTTAGDLRVWSVKDIYSAVALSTGHDADSGSKAQTKLKFSLRGRALSGHRGGVTCIDVPSHVYRPDSLVTGGADGLIKLWSLRAPTGGRRAGAPGSSETDTAAQQRGRGGDALSILNGHTSRVMCVKTAWHGDRLLSGGADRTIRIWDLAGTSGKCLHTLSGHFGWVTKVQYWGPNTIISASTDRSIALWDARVRNAPLFMLRHHHSPISDILVGSRTDPLMVSAAADGTVATWDFRALSGNSSSVNTANAKDSKTKYKVVRQPAALMRHGLDTKKKRAAGSVLLSRGIISPSSTVLSVGTDAVTREWTIATGELLDESPTGHCDAVSSFSSFGQDDDLSLDASKHPTEGYLSSSWDGTIRMRKLIRDSD
jgi:WD40 repeat protein